jgi:arylsulfatase A-like enzyme/MoaA/NifB/PqqE/SkfB family radical SAM enzyme
MSSGKNIILISIDTLRYDCVGYQQDKRELEKYDVLQYLATPNLDRISEKSACFTQCVSTNTYTTSAHASVLTGLYPPRHGVRAFFKTKLHKEAYTLPEILKVYGYTTILITDTPPNFLPLDLARGFDLIFEKDEFSALKYIRENRGEKIFLLAHFFDVHDPYLMSKGGGYDNSSYFASVRRLYKQFGLEYPENARNGWTVWRNIARHIRLQREVLFPEYVKGVSRFDRERFSAFVDNINSLNLLEEGLLVIFSDHGEGKITNETPEKFGHSGDVFDNVIRVPLIIHHKDLSHSVSEKLVSIIDIFPTVLEFAVGKDPKDLLPYVPDGRSLFTSHEHSDVYSEKYNRHLDSRLKSFFGGFEGKNMLTKMSWLLSQRAVRTRRKKFILYGEPESLSLSSLEAMNNAEFMTSLYRKASCTFEPYEDYMKYLNQLNSNTISKTELLNILAREQFELYDLDQDPFEDNPKYEDINSPSVDSLKTRVIELSNPSVQTEDIFSPLEHPVSEQITRHLLMDTLRKSIDIISDNKNLFNELILRFLERNQELPDEKFLKKCYEVFFNYIDEQEYYNELIGLVRQGVPRNTVFMSKIFQMVEFRVSGFTHDHSTDTMEVAKDYAEKAKVAPGLELERKKEKIRNLRNQLREKDRQINAVIFSKTWKLGQLFGKFVSFTGMHNVMERIVHRTASSTSPYGLSAHIAPVNDTGLSNNPKNDEEGSSADKGDIESLPLEIMLITNYECVYSCSYCFAFKPDSEKSRRKYTAADWEKVFRSLYNRYGKCNLIMSGGEPFFYRDFVNFVINTTRFHYIHAGTNLFLKKESLEKIASDSVRDNLYVSASFHPEHENMETFIGKMVFLRDHGVTVRANGVLHPTHLTEMIELNNRCDNLSIPVGFFPFIGEFEGRKFPDEYSGPELDTIKRLPVWHQSPFDSKIRIPRTKGMLCYAGMKTIYLNPEGDVRRCMSVKETMGNVFNGSFTLLDKPEPCPVETCDCGLYWKYHIKNSV